MKSVFIDLNPYSILLAEVVAGESRKVVCRMEERQAAGAADAMELLTREVTPTLPTDAPIVALLRSSHRVLHFSSENDARRCQDPRDLPGFLRRWPRSPEGSCYAAAVKAMSGEPLSAGGLPQRWLLAVEPEAHIEALLAAFGPRRSQVRQIESSTFSAIGAFSAMHRASSIGGAMILWDLGREESVLALIDGAGARDIRHSTLGFDALADAVRQELGLPSRSAALGLLFSDLDATVSVRRKLLGLIERCLWPDLAALLAAVPVRPRTLRVVGPAAAQDWLTVVAAEALGLAPFYGAGGNWVHRWGVEVAPEVKPATPPLSVLEAITEWSIEAAQDRLAAGLSPAWGPLLHLIAGHGAGGGREIVAWHPPLWSPSTEAVTGITAPPPKRAGGSDATATPFPIAATTEDTEPTPPPAAVKEPGGKPLVPWSDGRLLPPSGQARPVRTETVAAPVAAPAPAAAVSEPKPALAAAQPAPPATVPGKDQPARLSQPFSPVIPARQAVLPTGERRARGTPVWPWALAAAVLLLMSMYGWMKARDAESLRREAEANLQAKQSAELERAQVQAKMRLEQEERERLERQTAEALAEAARQRQQVENLRRDYEARVLARGSLQIETVPPGAQVSVGEYRERVSPAVIGEIPPGRYPVTIQLQGYETVRMQAEVQLAGPTVLGPVQLRPLGAEAPPAPSAATASTQPVQSPPAVSAPTVEPPVPAAPSAPAPEAAAERAPPAQAVATDALAASVTLYSLPFGSTVRRNGEVLGVTPLTLVGLPPGHLVFEVESPGHVPETVEADAEPRADLKLFARLDPLDRVAAAESLAEPPRLLDGPPPDLAGLELPAGAARLRISVLVDRRGRVRDVQVLESGVTPAVESRCRDALQHWRFTPGRTRDHVVAARIQIQLDASGMPPRG